MTTLTADQVRDLRARYEPSTRLALAEEFNIDVATLWRIATRRTWGHVI